MNSERSKCWENCEGTFGDVWDWVTSFLDFYLRHCRRQTDGGGSAAAAAAAAEAATQALVVAIFCWGAEGGPRAETILVVQDPRADR